MIARPARAALALLFVGTAAAAAPVPARDTLAELRRQETSLRDRIARLELDALVADVDRDGRGALPIRIARPGSQLALNTAR